MRLRRRCSPRASRKRGFLFLDTDAVTPHPSGSAGHPLPQGERECLCKAVKSKSKAVAGVRALARRHSKAAVKVLAAIMNDEEGPATARVSAAQALLDRGWGKAAQPLAGEEVGLPILARIERVIVDPSLQTNNENGSGTDNGAHT